MKVRSNWLEVSGGLGNGWMRYVVIWCWFMGGGGSTIGCVEMLVVHSVSGYKYGSEKKEKDIR